MNHQDELARALGRELHDRVDGLHGTPISLQDVKGTASAIRRRRTIGTVAGSAAAVALVVPTLMFAGGTFTDSAPRPGPAESPSVTEAPRPSGPVVLAADAPQGADPAIAYLDGRTLVDGDRRIELGATYHAVARAGDEYVLARQGDPGTFIDVVDASGAVLESSETTQAVVGSPDGTAAAWATPAGDVLVRTAGRTSSLGSVDGPVDVMALVDGVAYVNHQAEQSRPETVTASGDGRSLADRFDAVRTVSADGAIAGFSAGQDTDVMTPPCSTVVDASGEVRFETCELAFEYAGAGFSPDGSMVVGFHADADGVGPRSITVLDATDGDELLAVEVEDARGRTAGSIVDTAWEDEEHVLVKVEGVGGLGLPPYDLFRVGLDGSVERVLEKGYDPGTMVQPWILVD